MKPAALALAVTAAAALILSAAFISQVRNYIRATFPGHFVLIIGGTVVVCIAAALVIAVLKIRTHRALRYGTLLAALAVAIGYTTVTSSPDPQIAWVERFHFVQYGLITFLFYRAWRPLADAGVLILPAIAAMITSTAEEWFQWFIPGRVGALEDVFLNWVAIACGLLFSVALDPPPAAPLHLSRTTARHAARTFALFVVVFGMFFDSVHVGHEIHDPAIGTFTSIYTESELHANAVDRDQRWALAPPIDRTRLAREDQYRTEGIQHVQERNRAWDRGDADAAWRENLILERYYAPVLNRGHSWSAEQRRDAETRSATAIVASAYQSAAYPYRIYTWSRVQLWGGILCAVAVVLLVGRPLVRTSRRPTFVSTNAEGTPNVTPGPRAEPRHRIPRDAP
jgi:VanZ family protein